MSRTDFITTADALLNAPGLGRCELIRGELIMMSPSGFEHGRLASRIDRRLGDFVEKNALGIVTGAGTGFVIARDPDTVRAPDVGFVRSERAPEQPTPGFFPGPPDLAVEVLSPNDRAGEVSAKVQDWLAAGCRAVWVVDPGKRTVAVYESGRQEVRFSIADELQGGDLLPGFRLPVAEIFAGP